MNLEFRYNGLVVTENKYLVSPLFGFFGLYCFRLLFLLNGTICSSKDRCSSIGVLWNLANKDDSKGGILKRLSILSGGIVSLLLKCR